MAAWTKRRIKSGAKKAIWYLNDEANHFGHAPAYHYVSLSVLNAKLNKLALYQSDMEENYFILLFWW